jgi:hypothetical protein
MIPIYPGPDPLYMMFYKKKNITYVGILLANSTYILDRSQCKKGSGFSRITGPGIVKPVPQTSGTCTKNRHMHKYPVLAHTSGDSKSAAALAILSN